MNKIKRVLAVTSVMDVIVIVMYLILLFRAFFINIEEGQGIIVFAWIIIILYVSLFLFWKIILYKRLPNYLMLQTVLNILFSTVPVFGVSIAFAVLIFMKL